MSWKDLPIGQRDCLQEMARMLEPDNVAHLLLQEAEQFPERLADTIAYVVYTLQCRVEYQRKLIARMTETKN